MDIRQIITIIDVEAKKYKRDITSNWKQFK